MRWKYFLQVLSASLKISKTRGVKFQPCPDLLTFSQKLVEGNHLPTEIALLAGKIYCFGRVCVSEEITVKELLSLALKATKIPKICYLSGIIDILQEAVDEEKSVILLGETIIDLLKSYSSKYYYSLKLLHTWLLYIKSTCLTRSNESIVYTKFLEPDGEILQILQMHWETPFAGCVELCSDCLSTICQIWHNVQPNCLYAELLTKTTLTDLLWKSKTKYLILSTLVPFIRFSEILCEHPDSVYSLTGSLNSNYLLPAGNSILRASCII